MHNSFHLFCTLHALYFPNFLFVDVQSSVNVFILWKHGKVEESIIINYPGGGISGEGWGVITF